LHFADEFDNRLSFHAPDLGLRHHIAEIPVVLPGPPGDGEQKRRVAMVVGLVNLMDQERALVGAVGFHAKVLGAIVKE